MTSRPFLTALAYTPSSRTQSYPTLERCHFPDPLSQETKGKCIFMLSEGGGCHTLKRRQKRAMKKWSLLVYMGALGLNWHVHSSLMLHVKKWTRKQCVGKNKIPPPHCQTCLRVLLLSIALHLLLGVVLKQRDACHTHSSCSVWKDLTLHISSPRLKKASKQTKTKMQLHPYQKKHSGLFHS